MFKILLLTVSFVAICLGTRDGYDNSVIPENIIITNDCAYPITIRNQIYTPGQVANIRIYPQDPGELVISVGNGRWAIIYYNSQRTFRGPLFALSLDICNFSMTEILGFSQSLLVLEGQRLVPFPDLANGQQPILYDTQGVAISSGVIVVPQGIARASINYSDYQRLKAVSQAGISHKIIFGSAAFLLAGICLWYFVGRKKNKNQQTHSH